MDNQRLILFLVFSFSILMLWDGWERQHAPEILSPQVQQNVAKSQDVPTVSRSGQPAAIAQITETGSLGKGEKLLVKTDLLEAEIDTLGGDIRHLELLRHKATEDKTKNFVLLDDRQKSHLYVAQSGLISNGLPNHKTLYTAKAGAYALADGSDSLEVKLSWQDAAGIQVDKVYTFHRGSYVIDVRYDIRNGSGTVIEPFAYFQLVHDSASAEGSMMMPTFTGAAYFTETDKFKKISFDEMKKANLSKNANDGWIGMVQHYFVSAWLPKQESAREYYTDQLGNDLFSVGSKQSMGTVASGGSGTIGARLFSGPQEQAHLKEVAPGLEYAVDYGWLTVVATPLFWLLSQIQKLVQNWGVAIILLTVLIKAVFYPLSAASYKSMAQMRKVAPRLQQIKERYGDDREKLHKAMMELYKNEKINPMGGCLPIIVQVPVFIALYWVLLGSVEMRQAPFMLWITDLTATDPYFVLPVLMGASMIIQTSLNPTPPDPIQAKMMKIMPVAFSVFFFFFPAGLVLYWLVNNILSIAQQWAINRSIEGGSKA